MRTCLFRAIDVAQHFGLTESAIHRLAARNSSAPTSKTGSLSGSALCALRETRAVGRPLSPSYFFKRKFFPTTTDVIVPATPPHQRALLREYYRNGFHSRDADGARLQGGYTAIFFTGVARNVWHCDIASLYPSVMLQFDCFPVTDQLQIFRHLLTDLRTFRLEAKAQMQSTHKENNRQRWLHLHALQNTFKILINSFYGYLGFAQGNFADFDAAARVTQIGRELLQKMIDWLNGRGAQVIEVDTDGIYFVPLLL